MSDLSEIVAALKQRRQTLRWSQEAIAGNLDVSARSFGAWERCEKEPKWLHLVMWAESLGMELVAQEKGQSELPVPGDISE